jgi:hypothetical protein
MMMNAKTGKLMTRVGVVLTFGLIFLGQSPAQETRDHEGHEGHEAQSNCKRIKAHSIEPAGSGTCCTATATITNGGILNGTMEIVYSPAFVFTPDPNVVSYISEFTLTTNLGQLKGSNVYIYNLVTGLWTAMGHINPDTSTGRFAGATGVPYFNGKTVGVLPDQVQSYPSVITGEICFADEEGE